MMELRILSYDGGAAQATGAVAIGQAGCSFGRGTDNMLVLNDPERLVSRNQARIEPSATGYVLINTSSANTLLLNDREIGPGENAPVISGDLIHVGRFVLALSEPAGQPQVTPGASMATERQDIAPQASAQANTPSSDTFDPLAAFGVESGNGINPIADLLGPVMTPPQARPSPAPSMASPVSAKVSSPPPAGDTGVRIPVTPSPATDLFAGLDFPGVQSSSVGPDLGIIPSDPDTWEANTKPDNRYTGFTSQAIIPEDFNPFDLPSLAPRNTDDPLADLKPTHISGLEDRKSVV
jgi:predicted component of type VI protein secretion system